MTKETTKIKYLELYLKHGRDTRSLKAQAMKQLRDKLVNEIENGIYRTARIERFIESSASEGFDHYARDVLQAVRIHIGE
jgi:hypothetical protein